MTMVYPEPDEFAKAHPFTASAQIDPYYCPPWARRKEAPREESEA